MAKFRKSITIKQGNITSDELEDSRFDDGVKVKDEVLEWLTSLRALDTRAQDLVPLTKSMLAQAKDRPAAAFVSEALRKVLL